MDGWCWVIDLPPTSSNLPEETDGQADFQNLRLAGEATRGWQRVAQGQRESLQPERSDLKKTAFWRSVEQGAALFASAGNSARRDKRAAAVCSGPAGLSADPLVCGWVSR